MWSETVKRKPLKGWFIDSDSESTSAPVTCATEVTAFPLNPLKRRMPSILWNHNFLVNWRFAKNSFVNWQKAAPTYPSPLRRDSLLVFYTPKRLWFHHPWRTSTFHGFYRCISMHKGPKYCAKDSKARERKHNTLNIRNPYTDDWHTTYSVMRQEDVPLFANQPLRIGISQFNALQNGIVRSVRKERTLPVQWRRISINPRAHTRKKHERPHPQSFFRVFVNKTETPANCMTRKCELEFIRNIIQQTPIAFRY